MNKLLKDFVENYIYEMQNIPVYENGTKSLVAWYDDVELEEIFETAKENVSDILSKSNVKWVLERSEFADDVEKAVLLNMAVESLGIFLDAESRSKKTGSGKKLDGYNLEKEEVDTLNELANDYSETFGNTIADIITRAEQSPGKPI